MKKQHAKQMDMLHGSLLDKMLLFALPLAASSILQQLFNSADVAVVGRFAGNEAQAAVTGNTSVITLLINLFVGISVGANVVIAHYIGQNEKKMVRNVVHTVITLAIISGFLLMAVGLIVAAPILTMMDTPAEVMDQAVLYLRLYFLGMPFLMIYNFGSAILRTVGDTRRPLYCLVISGVLNVCLNLLFVIAFQMDVAGVAIATVLSNGVSASLIFYFLLHEDDMIRVDIHKLSLEKIHLRRILRIGIPAGLQGMVFSLSNVCIQTAINSFGQEAMSGSGSAVNFEFFTYFVTSAFSQAAVTFTSQNYGAKQYDRCKKIYRLSILSGIAITGLMCTVFVLFRSDLIRIYTMNEVAIKYGLIRMLHVEAFAFLPVIYEVSGAALRGMEHSLLPALVTLFGSCALRILWVYTVFKKYSSFEMLMNVYPITWALTAVLVFVSYLLVRKRVFRL